MSQLRITVADYAGPMEVLLALVRAGRYPVDALPVVEITGLFLDYVRRHTIDEELGGEFLDVASWLVLLRSRALLPQRANEPLSLAAERELQEALVDYETMRAAAEFLSSRQPRREGLQPAGTPHALGEQSLPLTMAELIENTRRALETAHAARELTVVDRLEDRIELMMDWVQRELETEAIQSSEEWFAGQPHAAARLLLLQALLELAARGEVLLRQSRAFGPIFVKDLRGTAPISEYQNRARRL